MKCVSLFSVLLVIAITIQPIISFCYFDRVKIDISEDGNITPYCNGPEGNRMSVGEKVRHECVDCTCTKFALSCCGVGYKGGIISYEGCKQKVYPDTCCFEFFKVDNPNERCENTKLECPGALS